MTEKFRIECALCPLLESRDDSDVQLGISMHYELLTLDQMYNNLFISLLE